MNEKYKRKEEVREIGHEMERKMRELVMLSELERFYSRHQQEDKAEIVRGEISKVFEELRSLEEKTRNLGYYVCANEMWRFA